MAASTTTLVQTASYVPIFLFALFAGVIADRVDRPKFLFFCNLFMALCACTMAVLVVLPMLRSLVLLVLINAGSLALGKRGPQL